jgi:hypothetical protein
MTHNASAAATTHSQPRDDPDLEAMASPSVSKIKLASAFLS